MNHNCHWHCLLIYKINSTKVIKKLRKPVHYKILSKRGTKSFEIPFHIDVQKLDKVLHFPAPAIAMAVN